MVRDWPDRAAAARPDHVIDYQFMLPRALATSRYLRWLDDWATNRRTADLTRSTRR